MSVWGPGVYQSDDACDVLDAVCGPLLAVIGRATASDAAMRADVEESEQLIPALDLLATVSEHVSGQTRQLAGVGWLYPCELPEPSVVQGWKERYLAVWEAAVGDLGPARGYRVARRRVIAAAFDRLAAAARTQRLRWRRAERRIGFPGKPLGQPLTPKPGRSK